jgi:hypothetical protein
VCYNFVKWIAVARTGERSNKTKCPTSIQHVTKATCDNNIIWLTAFPYEGNWETKGSWVYFERDVGSTDRHVDISSELTGFYNLLNCDYTVMSSFSLWVKRQGCEADHSISSTSEVKIDGDILHSPITSSRCDALLNRQLDNFTFSHLPCAICHLLWQNAPKHNNGLSIRLLYSAYVKTSQGNVRSEVFMTLAIKNSVFWDMAPCRSCMNRRFGGTYRPHLHGWEILEEEPAWGGGCYLEDGGNTFPRNVGSHKIYTASHHRRRRSS